MIMMKINKMIIITILIIIIRTIYNKKQQKNYAANVERYLRAEFTTNKNIIVIIIITNGHVEKLIAMISFYR